VVSGFSRTDKADVASGFSRTSTPSLAQTAARAAAKIAEPAPREAVSRTVSPTPSRTDVAPSVASNSAQATVRPVGGVAEAGSGPSAAPSSSPPTPPAKLKDSLLSEIRSSNAMMYNTLVAQAQRMHIDGDRIVLAFAPAQKIGPTFDKYKPALEAIATKLAGRKMTVAAEVAAVAAANGAAEQAAAAENDRKKSALREQALGDPAVQALLEVFPAEIRDVEEM